MDWRAQSRSAAEIRKGSRQRVIILAGLPGSGKTTVAKQLQNLGWVWVNQDTLGSRRACEEALVSALHAGREVVVDRCNFDVSQRSFFLNLACRCEAEVTALQLTTPVKECIRRAKGRRDHPTLNGDNIEGIITRFASEFVAVHRHEGFRDVHTAANAEEIDRFIRLMGPAQPTTSRFAAPPSRHQPISRGFPFPGQQQYRHQPSYHHQHTPDYKVRAPPGHEAQFPPHPQYGAASGWDGRNRRQYGQPQPLHHEHMSVITELTQSQAQHQQQVQHQQVQHQQVHMGYQQQQWQQQPFPAGQHARNHSGGLLPYGSERSSVVPFPGSYGRSWPVNGAAKAVAQQRFLDVEVPRAPNDTRPIALFDLNGTLTSHTARRQSAGINKIRPGVHHLMRLHDTFRIGVFTSASLRTVQTVVPMLESAAGSTGRPLLAEKDFILTRSHTEAAPDLHVLGGGNKWDTVKPLNKWFKDLSRVFLVDDDAYKAVPSEENNMIVVPCWESNEDDTVLAALTDALLDIMGTLSADADVRRYTKAVQEAVALKVGCPVGLEAQPADPEEVELGAEDDSMEEEMQEHAIPAAQQSHLVMI
ncbi:probable bifunctional polynucleotide phosphatase/kinase at N-terminal half [Coccomyxa sp. Obi]|nr:probable bifunctional polynucleotide phosphatase/kinase at N-terminal half [Coccomyxa sp. Obi]